MFLRCVIYYKNKSNIVSFRNDCGKRLPVVMTDVQKLKKTLRKFYPIFPVQTKPQGSQITKERKFLLRRYATNEQQHQNIIRSS